MKNKLLIVGASGHGKVVADIAMEIDKWDEIAFLDDDENVKSSMGLEIIGTSDDIFTHIDEYEIFVGIGNNTTRQKIHGILERVGANIPILIHPKAVIGRQVEVGIGTVVMAGAIVNCCTHIGKGCIVNTGATIDHDNCIEGFVHISPGAHLAGTVNVGKGSWLGIGSIVSNNVNIPKGCTIGAGSSVIKDIQEAGIYVGTPVRKLDY
ncbi:acetyltransferase [Halobacillus aidingensis]|uniref:Sugar O-acyltransferase, sialic acid O-acetyltransferase NeuD family n=1 Tax=Halobacillus aidingensis TaxID=240303 RepID=A0A1H0KJT4_HALAD|nr:acetyltransferase [Halobacillus aidingensis]SDO56207.1 sugar O-acyltransferase, sialic acid O-acetyltransferase NeuD family [Halobacillus aidingensis]